MKRKGQAKQNTKKKLKEMLNWTSSTEISSTGRTDAYSIGASDGCRKIRRPGIGARLSASRDQVKKEVKHRLNRRCQVKYRCIQRTMIQRWCQVPRSQVFSTSLIDSASEHSVGAMTSAEVGGLTASPGAVCDRFNRCPMHPTATSVAVSDRKNRCPCTESSDAYAEKLLTATNG